MTDQIPPRPAPPPVWGQQAPTQHQPAAPGSPPTGPSRPFYRHGWFLFLAGGLVGLVLGVGAGSTDQAPDRAGPATSDRPAATAASPTPTDAPATTAAAEPRPGDFRLTVKTLSKQCFGSAGCNLSYRIEVGYDGPMLDPVNTYEVVYEVRGGEDGPQINTLTVEGDQSSVESEELISTSSPSRKLTAVVTSVDLVP
jgi:hypothetical protein